MLTWPASIALSWLWGLGFFFSIHFAFSHGFVGLLVFAVPNALGLFLFGLVAERLGDGNATRRWIEAAFARYGTIFVLFQIAAVSLTLFALMAYLALPAGADLPFAVGFAVLALSVFVAEAAGFPRIRFVHLGLLGSFIVLALSLTLFAAPAGAPRVPASGPGGSEFLSYLVPLTLGLLLGPWMDLQQWQRVVAIAQSGRSVSRAFAIGAGIFFVILTATGSLGLFLVPPDTVAATAAIDGRTHAEAIVAFSLVARDGGFYLFLFGLMALIAALTTCDSSYLALRWFLTKAEQSASNPLLAMLPTGLIRSPLPALGAAFAIAAIGVAASLELEHFMVLFATIFLAYAIALCVQAIRRSQPTAPPALLPLSGLVALGMMAIGYFEHIDGLMMVSGLIPLAAALVWLRGGAGNDSREAVRPGDVVAVDRERGDNISPQRPQSQDVPGPNGSPPSAWKGAAGRSEIWLPEADLAATFDGDTMNGYGDRPDRLTDLSGWFDKKWFTIHIVPTYGDTNSVGNVYFASYVAWIGKARELFFRHCMPQFELDKTPYFILTRNFNHKFKRETKEFDTLTVRLKIESFNRKFVKLRHEIRDRMDKIIGEGEQTLMFVGTNDYRLIDIPGDVYNAFIPHA